MKIIDGRASKWVRTAHVSSFAGKPRARCAPYDLADTKWWPDGRRPVLHPVFRERRWVPAFAGTTTHPSDRYARGSGPMALGHPGPAPIHGALQACRARSQARCGFWQGNEKKGGSSEVDPPSINSGGFNARVRDEIHFDCV